MTLTNRQVPDPRNPNSPPAAKRGRKRDAGIDERILIATREAVADLGVRGASVSAVAGIAGIGKPTFYLRWPDPSSVILAAVQSLGHRLGSPKPASLDAQLRWALWDDYSTLVCGEDARFIREVVFESRYSPGFASGLETYVFGPRHKRLAGLVRDHESAPEPVRSRADAAADFLLAPLYRDLALLNASRGREDIDGWVNALLRVPPSQQKPASAG